jgi:hypothetical protein
MLTLNGTLVLGPNFTLLRKVERSLPARSSTSTAARRLRARAYCEAGKLCLQSHLLVPVSSAREPLGTTVLSTATMTQSSIGLMLALATIFGFDMWAKDINQAYLKSASPSREKYLSGLMSWNYISVSCHKLSSLFMIY